MQNPRLADLMGTLNHKEQFIVSALETLLEASAPGTVNAILDDILPVAPSPMAVLFGRKIHTYAGLSRVQIKAKFGLTDANVDAIYAALGVVEGAQGAAGMPVEGMFQDSYLNAQAGEGREDGSNDGKPSGQVTEAVVTTDVSQTDDDGTTHVDVSSDNSPTSDTGEDGGGSDENAVDQQKAALNTGERHQSGSGKRGKGGK